jgi:hypothetical protein
VPYPRAAILHARATLFLEGFGGGDEVFRPAKVIVNDLGRVEASGIEEKPKCIRKQWALPMKSLQRSTFLRLIQRHFVGSMN